MNKVKYFYHNTVGLDYVIGDIHGCYDEVIKLLDHAEFDKNVDRLFSVGDLIDRGPKSIDVIKLLSEPWFHAVRGNHDEMMIRTILDDSRSNQNDWLNNGGHWYLDIDNTELNNLATLMREKMPLVMVIGKYTDNRINIVHAEFTDNYDYQPVTDTDIDDWYFHEYQENDMIWGRRLVKLMAIETVNAKDIKLVRNGLSDTYVGHTPIVGYEIRKFESHIFIDHGACYNYKHPTNDNHLTMIRLTDDYAFQYSMKTGTINDKP